jgi:protein-disulfide isomerase
LISRTLICSFLGSAALMFAASDGGAEAKSDNPVAVEIDGTKITMSDFESKRPLALFQARNNFFEAERKALEAYAEEYLLERQAQKENLTVAQLLDKHVNSTIAGNPDDDALRLYYEGIETAEPFDAARSKILDHIREKRIATAKKAYLQSLHDQAKIAVVLAPPRAPISLSNTPIHGAANAPVTLVEFADYECHYCQVAQPDLDKLQAEFKGKLAFAYKDLPLPMHGHAEKASEAAQCAGVQNKYWEYHDELFKTAELELPQLKSAAGKLGLDTKAFDECLDSGKGVPAIQATLEEAQKLGLQGTPSFFLNGRFINGIMKYEQLKQMVEDEIKSTSNQK